MLNMTSPSFDDGIDNHILRVLGCYQCFGVHETTLQFLYTKVLCKKDNDFFLARYQTRATLPSDVDVRSLNDVELISSDSYCPPPPPGCTEAAHPPSNECFVKRPNLIGYTPDSQIQDNVLKEVSVCEILRKNPHRNIAEYHGCEIRNGRVTGLCFKRYLDDLQLKLNPESLNKLSFQNNQRPPLADALRYLKGIKSGLDHLHSLGFSHNDINPANIMLDHDDKPIIIDFDSCLRHGTPLAKTKRTYGWHGEKIQISQPCNDDEALAELWTWLTSVNPDEFQFMV